MEPFNQRPGEVVYLLAATPEAAERYAKSKRLRNYTVLRGVEDYPREKDLLAIIVGTDSHLHPDWECFFGVGGLFYDFKARLYYGHEVPRREGVNANRKA